ncbi:MAG: Ig-like domain-containing protein [Candidatus Woesearchaeota archaeon]
MKKILLLGVLFLVIFAASVFAAMPTWDSWTPFVNPTIDENQSQLFTAVASDTDPHTLTYTWYADGAPVLSGVDETEFTFNADYDSAGIYSITVDVDDGNGYVLAGGPWTLTVNNVNRDPVLDIPIVDQVWLESTDNLNAFDLDDFFSDPDGDTLTYTASIIDNPNVVVSIDGNNVASFTQPLHFHGIETVTFTADDGVGGTLDSNLVTLTVKPHLEIESVILTVDGFPALPPLTKGQVIPSDIDGDTIPDITPDTNIEVQVTLKNNGQTLFNALGLNTLDGDVTKGGLIDHDDVDIFLIEAGQSTTRVLEFYLPSDVTPGVADVDLAAQGISMFGTYNDDFDFDITIDRFILDGIIENENVVDPTLICDKTTELEFRLTNIGAFAIPWYNVVVTGNNGLGEIYNEVYSGADAIAVAANKDFDGTDFPPVPIDLTGMPLGTYDLEIEFIDLFGLYTLDTIGGITVTNENCPVQFDLAPPVPDVTVDEDVCDDTTIGDLDDYLDVDTDGLDPIFIFADDDNLLLTLDGDNILEVCGEPDWSGTRTVTVTADDLQGATDDDVFVVEIVPVNDAPVIDDILPQNVNEDEEFLYTATSTDVEGDNLAFSLIDNDGAAGFTVDANGDMHGFTPTNAEVGNIYTITIDVTDDGQSGDPLAADPQTDTFIFTLTVDNVNDAPSITTVAPLAATEDSPYNYDVDATDSDVGDVLTYSLVTSPTGMTINPTTGLVEWTPLNEHVGLNDVEVKVDDGNSGEDNEVFQIDVANTNDAPAIDPISDIVVKQGETVAFSVTATDEDPVPDTLIYTMATVLGSQAATGSTLLPTGEFSWVPSNTQFGDFEIEFTATDNGVGLLSDSTTMTITVLSVLKITDIDAEVENPDTGSTNFNDLLEGDTLSAEAGDTVTLDLEILNDHVGEVLGDPKAIGDIVAEANVPTVPASDATTPFNIGPQESVQKTLTFEVPSTTAAGTYNLVVEANGMDDFTGGVSRHDEINLVLEVTKLRHNIAINDLAITNDNLRCVRITTLDVTLQNIGKVVEDDIAITVSNAGIGLDEVIDSQTLLVNQEDVFTFADLDLSAADPGALTLDVEVTYDNMDGYSADSIDVTIEDCSVADQTTLEDTAPTFSVNLAPLGLSSTGFSIDDENLALIDCDIAAKVFTCGTPLPNQNGVSNIDILVTDGLYENHVLFDVIVTPVNDGPEISPIGPFSVDEKADFLLNVTPYISDLDNNAADLIISHNSIHVYPTPGPQDIGFRFPVPGPQDVLITVRDPLGEEDSTTVHFDVIDVPEAPTFDPIPTFTDINVVNGADYEFAIENVIDPDPLPDTTSIQWSAGPSGFPVALPGETSETYTYSTAGVGTYTVLVVVSDTQPSTPDAEFEWTVEVTDAPLFDGDEITYGGGVNTAATDVVIENSHGSVTFDGPIDLTRLHDLDQYIIISEGFISINTAILTELAGESAEVTLHFTGIEDPQVFYSSGFELGPAGLPRNLASVTVIDEGPDYITFEVSGFSTYWVGGNHAPVANAGVDFTGYINEQITLQGSATDSDGDSLAYAWTQVSGPVNVTLSDASTLNAKFTTAGIGTYTFAFYTDDGSLNSTDQVSVTVTERPKLRIKDLEVRVDGEKDTVNNGEKISDKAKPGQNVKFKAEVCNDYTDAQDIEIQNVVVTVTIDGIDDGDEIEEESSESDIKADDCETFDVELNLPDDAEEDEYDVEIMVEGDDEIGLDHVITWDIVLEVEREKHQIKIKDAFVSPSIITCEREASFSVKIQNVGQDDENDVAIKIENSALGINVEDEDIELDYAMNDENSNYQETYQISIGDNIAEGTYPIKVTTYYDRTKDSETQTVDLEVSECYTETTRVAQPVYYAPPTPTYPQDVIIDYQPTPVVYDYGYYYDDVSFRDSDEYILLLVIVGVILLGLVGYMIGVAARRR